MDNAFELTTKQIDQIKTQISIRKDGGERSIIAAKMVNVFIKHKDGKDVLAFLLKQMNYGVKITSPQDMVLYNLAVGILDLLKEAEEGDTASHIDYSLRRGD